MTATTPKATYTSSTTRSLRRKVQKRLEVDKKFTPLQSALKKRELLKKGENSGKKEMKSGGSNKRGRLDSLVLDFPDVDRPGNDGFSDDSDGNESDQSEESYAPSPAPKSKGKSKVGSTAKAKSTKKATPTTTTTKISKPTSNTVTYPRETATIPTNPVSYSENTKEITSINDFLALADTYLGPVSTTKSKRIRSTATTTKPRQKRRATTNATTKKRRKNANDDNDQESSPDYKPTRRQSSRGAGRALNYVESDQDSGSSDSDVDGFSDDGATKSFVKKERKESNADFKRPTPLRTADKPEAIPTPAVTLVEPLRKATTTTTKIATTRPTKSVEPKSKAILKPVSVTKRRPSSLLFTSVMIDDDENEKLNYPPKTDDAPKKRVQFTDPSTSTKPKQPLSEFVQRTKPQWDKSVQKKSSKLDEMKKTGEVEMADADALFHNLF